MVDINGDGLKDVVLSQAIIETDGTTQRVLETFFLVSRNQGAGTFAGYERIYTAGSFQGAPGATPHSVPTVLDYDFDGRQDLLLVSYASDRDESGTPQGQGCVWVQNPNIHLLLRSTGTGFEEWWVSLPASHVHARVDGRSVFLPVFTTRLVFDANGDGHEDLAYMAMRGDQPVYAAAMRDLPRTGLLTSAADGLGREWRFEYKPLSDSSVYERSGVCDYPLRWDTSRRWVVARSEVQQLARNAPDPFQSWGHKYGNARLHPRGRRSVGFERRRMITSLTGETTHIRYDNRSRLAELEVFPYAGIPQDVIVETPLLKPDGWHYERTARFSVLKSRVLGQPGGPRSYSPYVDWSLLALSDSFSEFDVRTEAWSQVDLESRYRTTETIYAYSKTDDLFFGMPEVIDSTTRISSFGRGGGPAGYWSRSVTTIQFRYDLERWLVALPEYRIHSVATSRHPLRTRTTRYEYEPASGRLERVILMPGDAAFELSTSFSNPDRFGNATWIEEDPAVGNNRVTQVRYDARGIFPEWIRDPEGYETHTCFHAGLGVPVRKEEAGGLVTTYSYDGFGRPTREVRPDGTKASWLYGSNHPQFPDFPFFVKSYETPNDREAIEERDLGGISFLTLAGRLGAVYRRLRDDRWSLQEFRYDTTGSLSSVGLPYHYPGGAVGSVSYTRDGLGRATGIDHPDGRHWSFDYDRMTVTANLPDGHSTTVVSDEAGLPLSGINKAGQRTAYEYDGWGQRVREVDPAGHATVWQYNLRGLPYRVTHPDFGVVWSYYDSFGQLTSQLFGGKTTRWVYDKLGRQTRAEYDVVGNVARGDIAFWQFDDRLFPGRLSSKSFGGNSTEYDYDNLGRVNGVTTRIVDRTFQIDLSYNRFGKLENVTYPEGPGGVRLQVRYHYTESGRLQRVADPQVGDYWRIDASDAEDRITQETFGNEVKTIRDVDPVRGVLRSVRTGRGDAQVQDLHYEYDPHTLSLKAREDRNRHTRETFDYDILDRLTHWREDGVLLQECRYDPLGNIAFKTGVEEMRHTNAARPHRLTRAGADNLTYDLRGNILQAPGYRVEWTPFNKPSRIVRNNQHTVFLYDAEGYRVREAAPEGVTYYVEGLFELFEGGGKVEARSYVHAGGRIVAKVVRKADGVRTWYLHDDHLGSTSAMTDHPRTETVRLAYDPWGARRPGHDPVRSGSHPGFTGHEHDDGLNLINKIGREYDPRLGRFLSPDPVGQSPNGYSYVDNNPTKYVDPSGHFYFGGWGSDGIPPGGSNGQDDMPEIGISASIPIGEAPAGSIYSQPWAAWLFGGSPGITGVAGYGGSPEARGGGGSSPPQDDPISSDGGGGRDDEGPMAQLNARFDSAMTLLDGTLIGHFFPEVAHYAAMGYARGWYEDYTGGHRAWNQAPFDPETELWERAGVAIVPMGIWSGGGAGGKGGNGQTNAVTPGRLFFSRGTLKPGLGSTVHSHHYFPKQLRQFFQRAGINIEEWQGPVLRGNHIGKGGLHPRWNAEWRRFANHNPNASQAEIIDHLYKMIDRIF